MTSNRDYATEILNLYAKIEKLEKENQELKELQELNKQGLWNLKQENQRLKEDIDKAQDLEIGNLEFINDENKYQTSIRVLKEAFISLGKSDIAHTCWFKYLEELEKENKKLKEEYEMLDRVFNSCHLDYEDLKGENEKYQEVLENDK